MNIFCRKPPKREETEAERKRKQGYKLYYVKTEDRHYPVWAKTDKQARGNMKFLSKKPILEVLEEGENVVRDFNS